MSGVGQALGWSLASALAFLAAGLIVRGARRRRAINEALHELRRPLQVVALSSPQRAGSEGSGRLIAEALDRLEREVNGGRGAAVRVAVRVEAIVRSAAGRWRPRVALAGGSLEVRWRAGDATVAGDPHALEQALDNLIVNAIEHGGSRVVVSGRRSGDRVLVSVADSGRPLAPGSRYPGPEGRLARFAGRRRHGHGIAVVRKIAADHGGRFVLRHVGDVTEAVLELPALARSTEPGP